MKASKLFSFATVEDDVLIPPPDLSVQTPSPDISTGSKHHNPRNQTQEDVVELSVRDVWAAPSRKNCVRSVYKQSSETARRLGRKLGVECQEQQ
jgi:hypothetical protein